MPAADSDFSDQHRTVPTAQDTHISADEYGCTDHGSDVSGIDPNVFDHIVFAVPDLAGGVAGFERLTGVRPVRGGSHVGLGTANHLVGLGDASYLEIIGPDPDQPEPVRPRPFGIDGLTVSRVVTWSIRPPDLDHAVTAAIARGSDPGPARAMSRRLSDGTS